MKMTLDLALLKLKNGDHHLKLKLFIHLSEICHLYSDYIFVIFIRRYYELKLVIPVMFATQTYLREKAIPLFAVIGWSDVMLFTLLRIERTRII